MRVLIDTSGLLALSRKTDQHHAEAVALARAHTASGGRYLGTTLILGELHSHLFYMRGPEEARTALVKLLDDPVHEWLEVSAELLREAAGNWLFPFQDQTFSLVDAVSFEVMRRERIDQAFAFDHHFEVAGFGRMGRR